MTHENRPKYFSWSNFWYLKGSSSAHNFATIDDRDVELSCGDSIRHKLSIHVLHLEIGVNFFLTKLKYINFWRPKNLTCEGGDIYIRNLLLTRNNNI
jgi:hypothetical protein